MVPPHPLHPAHHPHTAMYHHAAAHQQQLNHHQQRGYQGYPQHKQQPRFCGPQPPPHAMQQHPINRAVVAGPHAHPVPNNYHAAAAAARGPSLPPPRHLHPPHPHHRGGCMAPMPHIPPHHPHHHHLHPHHHAYNNNPHRGYNMPPNSYGQQATVPTLPKPPTQPSTTNFTAEIDTSCPPPVPATSTGSALIATMGQPSTASVEAPTNLVPPKYTSAPEQSPTKKMGEPNTISQDNVTAPKLVVGESNHERGMEIDQVADDNDKAVNEDICPPQSPTFAAATAVKPSLAIHTGSELSTIETTTTTQVVAVKSVKKSVSMQQQAKPRIAVMSPITMCFERMLGAAEYIKTPGSNSAVAHQRQLKLRGPLIKKVLPMNTGNNMRTKRPSKDNDAKRNPFEELADDPDLERLVILQMAMQRNQHGNQFHPLGTTMAAENKLDVGINLLQPKREVSHIITEGFFWREYPTCEQVLYNHMNKYYEISAIQKNYKVQQIFNNVLVEEVRKAAVDSGFVVDPDFCDKKLRDRIRCFYKTHLQNAKKRLATLQKHADSLENQCLVAVFIRCVRNPDLTFEDSLAMATPATTSGDEENSTTTTKKRRLDKVEKLKLSVVKHDHTASCYEATVASAKDAACEGPVSRVQTTTASLNE